MAQPCSVKSCGNQPTDIASRPLVIHRGQRRQELGLNLSLCEQHRGQLPEGTVLETTVDAGDQTPHR